MGKARPRRSQESIRVTLSTGESLDIRDDLIAKAFRELAASIGRKWNVINNMEELLGNAKPIVQYVAAGDNYVKEVPAPAEKAKEVLAEILSVMQQIEQEHNLG